MAVVAGAGYDDEDIAAMRDACTGKEGGGAPWLRPDLDAKMPSEGPEYGKATAERIKACMKALQKDGKWVRAEVVIIERVLAYMFCNSTSCNIKPLTWPEREKYTVQILFIPYILAIMQ